jgi:hypothetical protein
MTDKTKPQASQLQQTMLPIAGRSMDLQNLTRAPDDNQATPLASAEIVFTTGAQVQRYDWARDRYYLEELSTDPSAIRLERLQRGAPLLNTHGSYDLNQVLGVVTNPVIGNGIGTATVTFSRREDVAGYVQDVADKIIRNVSVGYARHKMEMIAPAADGSPWVYRVTDWEPMEVSLVPIPADMDAQVRAAGNTTDHPSSPTAAPNLRTYPCEIIEHRSAGTPPSAAHPVTPTVGISAATSTTRTLMPEATDAGGNTTTTQTTQDAATRSAADQTAALQAAAARAADITDLCQRHGTPTLASALIREGKTVDEARAAVLNELATRDASTGGHRNVRIETVTDEHAIRMAGVEQAILHRVSAKTKLDDNGKQYRGMSLLELGREFLEASGVSTRGMDRLTLATRMLHHRTGGGMGTGDFSSLFANVANKRLRAAYDENMATYDMWARRAPNAPDFKNIQVTSISGAPELLQTNEHGEFKYGSMTDGAETYAVITYGRIVNLTRQAIINDDLRAFDRLVSAFGNSSKRLENRLVYSQLTANGNLADGGALFNATAVTTTGGHANLTTGGGSALALAGLTASRLAMRLQKGLQSETLNISPAFLIVPAALEATAYQLTSANYVPATQSNINEFRSGGRTALEPIVEPLLDASSATAWYLAANSGQIDTVEYCYLDGAEGPMIESEVGFEVDGISYKCREDFAAKAIDFRGLHKAAGA